MITSHNVAVMLILIQGGGCQCALLTFERCTEAPSTYIAMIVIDSIHTFFVTMEIGIRSNCSRTCLSLLLLASQMCPLIEEQLDYLLSDPQEDDEVAERQVWGY